MTDRAPSSRAELDGRRVVVDLSDVDGDRLATIAARSGVAGAELVLGWIRRGLLDGPVDPGARQARDVEVARQADEAFRDLLGGPDLPD